MKKMKGERKRRPKLNFGKWLRGVGFKVDMVIAVSALLAFGLFCLISTPVRYDLQVGSIAPVTITASKDVLDEYTTEERRKAAANAVEPTYHLAEGTAEEVLTNLSALFSELRTVQQYGMTLLDAGSVDVNGVRDHFTETELAYARGLVTLIPLRDYQLQTLLQTKVEDFDRMVTYVTMAVSNTLSATIREGQENQAITNIRQVVGYTLESNLFQNIVPAVLRNTIQPNMVIDPVSTELAREQARESIEPVMYLQGQNIIREGERVSLNQLQMLKELGLLSNDKIDYSVYGGAAMVVVLAMAVLVIMLRLLVPESLHDVRRMSVTMLVTFLTLLVSCIAMKTLNIYIAPTCLTAMLLTTLLGPGYGLAGTVGTALLVSALNLCGNNSYSAELIHTMLSALTGGTVAVIFLRNKPQRVRVLLCGVLIMALNFCTVFAMGLMTSNDMHPVVTTALWNAVGGLIGGVLAVGLQPVIETLFNLATASKLLELANPNHPLLRRLLIEAPGTYHHAIIVANLA